MTLDRKAVRELRDRIQGILDEAGIEDYDVRLGNCSYTGDNATFKLEVSSLNENGEAITKEANAFKELALCYGLKPEDLGATIILNGNEFEIVGLNTKARKNCINIKRKSDGRGFKTSAETVQMKLNH